MENVEGAQRRRFLKRGALLLGGVAGLGLAMRARPGEGAPTPGTVTMRLHGTDWRLTYPERRRGVLPTPGERSASFGQLFSGPGGEKVGEFYASSFQFGSPFGFSEVSATSMEMHQFNLGDGSIVGVGTVPDLAGDESVHAIIGGTGRYEGASGSYTARQNPLELGGDGTAEFEFHITLGSA
jgi:hypothetical protein